MSTRRPGLLAFLSGLILASVVVVGYPVFMLELGENPATRTLIGDIVFPIAGLLAAGGLIRAAGKACREGAASDWDG